MTFRLYTVANDRMAAHLPRFLTLKKCFLPDVPLYIIPFDDEQNEVRRILANEENVFFVEPDERIDNIGKTIYGDEEYRPGIPSWRYFRKLNAFSGHDTHFLFLDLNCLLLNDPRKFWDMEDLQADEIVFGNGSLKYRTIPEQNTQDFFNLLNPGWGAGFNAGLFFARGSFLDMHNALAVTGSALRSVLGKAPEQAFLTFYGTIFLKKASLVAARIDQLAPIRKPKDDEIYIHGEDLRYSHPRFDGKIILAIKNVSQELKSVEGIVKKYIDERFFLDLT